MGEEFVGWLRWVGLNVYPTGIPVEFQLQMCWPAPLPVVF